MKYTVSFLGLGLLLGSAYADDCKYSRDVERTLALDNASVLEVDARSGFLVIKGESGRSDVLIEAEVCASDKDMLDEMEVVSRTRSNASFIKTKIPQFSGRFFGNNYARINLTLTVPDWIELDVSDSSGEASIRNVAKLSMSDSSGELKITGITGDVKVKDSSGDMSLEEIDGMVEVNDSSGDIYASDLKQGLIVIADSSGDIEAQRVGYDVIIERDSSGSIDVEDVGGDFIVKKDSSGGIHYDDVQGDVELPRNKRDKWLK